MRAEGGGFAPAALLERLGRAAAIEQRARVVGTHDVDVSHVRRQPAREPGDERAGGIVGVTRIRRGQDADAHFAASAAADGALATGTGRRAAHSRRSHERMSTNDIGYTTVERRIPERHCGP